MHVCWRRPQCLASHPRRGDTHPALWRVRQLAGPVCRSGGGWARAGGCRYRLGNRLKVRNERIWDVCACWETPRLKPMAPQRRQRASGSMGRSLHACTSAPIDNIHLGSPLNRSSSQCCEKEGRRPNEVAALAAGQQAAAARAAGGNRMQRIGVSRRGFRPSVAAGAVPRGEPPSLPPLPWRRLCGSISAFWAFTLRSQRYWDGNCLKLGVSEQ